MGIKLSSKYRPDIDGLRALAVIPVVLFHAGISLFEGGFVGVDVFFVISGYLITLKIKEDCELGKFSILRFYERRIRRIFPALFVLLLSSFIAALVLFMPVELKRFSLSMAGAALSVSNFVFFREGGYFDGPSEFKPLLHTWSLGIEEQFYIFFPFLFALIFRKGLKFTTNVVFFLAISSFLLCIFITAKHQQAAFYLLPFRAWELLAGSLLTLKIFPNIKQRQLRNIISIAALGLIILPMLTYTKATPFPGFYAIFPVLGAALLIQIGAKGSVVSFLLRAKPLVFVGLISYSLYLWHWPLFSFTRYYLYGEPELFVKICVIFLSFLFAYLSWKWVEQPFRIPGKIYSRKKIFSGAFVAIFGVLTLACVGYFTQGLPQRLSPAAQHYAAMLDKELYFGIYDRGGCFLDYDQTAADYDLALCSNVSELDKNKEKILIYGDSFAAHYYPALRINNNVQQYTATSCRPFKTGSERCDNIYDRFITNILPVTDAKVIVIAAFWEPWFLKLGEEEFAAKLNETLQQVAKYNKQVVLVGQTPVYKREVPYILAIRGGGVNPVNLLEAKDFTKLNFALAKIAQSNNAIFVNPYEFACQGNKCTAAQEGMPFHWDVGHLTLEGSKFYAPVILEKIISSSADKEIWESE